MGTISPTLPTPGAARGGEETDVRNALVALINLVNGSLDAANLDDAAAVLLTQLAKDGSGPAMGAFSVSHGSTTSYSGGGAQTLVKFDTETFDVSGWFDPSSTNYRFTPQAKGIFLLRAQCKIESASDGQYYSLKLRRNGTVIREGITRSGATSDFVAVDALVTANGSGDYFDIVLENGGGSSQISDAHFEGHLVGLQS